MAAADGGGIHPAGFAVTRYPLILLLSACQEPRTEAPTVAPEPTPEPRLVMPGTFHIGVLDLAAAHGDYRAWVDLGQSSQGTPRTAIDLPFATLPDNASARLHAIARDLLGTPFRYESQLPEPPAGTLRADLGYLDCATFVYNALALSLATDVPEYVDALRQLRYRDGVVGPTSFFHYPNEAFDQAVRLGFAEDVTASLGPTFTLDVTQPAGPRSLPYDAMQTVIHPHRSQGQMTVLAATAPLSGLISGDVLLFTRLDPVDKAGLLVSHLGIADVQGERVSMIHATRDYAWKVPPSGRRRPFVREDPRRLQLGVSRITRWTDDPEGQQVRVGGEAHYGYENEARSLADYMRGAQITGIRVLRPRAFAIAAPTVRGVKMPAEVGGAITPCPGCPDEVLSAQVGVMVPYLRDDGTLGTGEIVVHRELHDEADYAFTVLWQSGFPLTSVLPVAAFEWSDPASMLADNTSGFNFRNVPGTRVLSKHACGRAIDINPRRNPYVRGDRVDPPGARYNPAQPGTFVANSEVVRRLTGAGWKWGGTWTSVKDYQHFELGTCEAGLAPGR